MKRRAARDENRRNARQAAYRKRSRRLKLRRKKLIRDIRKAKERGKW
jgi:hypothetical protein